MTARESANGQHIADMTAAIGPSNESVLGGEK